MSTPDTPARPVRKAKAKSTYEREMPIYEVSAVLLWLRQASLWQIIKQSYKSKRLSHGLESRARRFMLRGRAAWRKGRREDQPMEAKSRWGKVLK